MKGVEPSEDQQAGFKAQGRSRFPKWCWAAACCATVVVLFIVVVAAAVGFSASARGDSGGIVVTLADSLLRVPEWETGATFDYSFTRLQRGPSGAWQNVSKSVRAVNTGKNPATHQYMLAADQAERALEHAVLNGFPFFGRVASSDLGVYEDGAPQPLFGFWPIKAPSGLPESVAPWHFRLFQIDWQGVVVGFEPKGGHNGAPLIKFQASERSSVRGAAGNHFLKYELDLGAGFLKHLSLSDLVTGETQLEMKLDAFQPTGFKGTAYFVRATDLFDGAWPSNTSVAPSETEANEFGTAFDIGQHRTDGAWDMLVYVSHVTVGCDETSAASVKLTGRGSLRVALDHSFAACQTDAASYGTILQPRDEEYGVAVSLTGAKTRMRLRIAGGFWYNYTI